MGNEKKELVDFLGRPIVTELQPQTGLWDQPVRTRALDEVVGTATGIDSKHTSPDISTGYLFNPEYFPWIQNPLYKS